MRRGQIRRRSLDEFCCGNPAGCWVGPVYIHPGFQGGPGQIVVLNCDWPTIWDAVDAVGVRRSEDAPLGHSCLTCWFQAGFLSAANSHWPSTSAGALCWIPGRAEFLLAGDPSGLAGPATQDAEFSLVESLGFFLVRQRGRSLLGSL